ncbi:hypothetical protein ELG99_14040 [Rhizobium ruizarguesonis]|nr:hypothetical protein ELG99_14040 [Rhizobium ruizarguesonis]
MRRRHQRHPAGDDFRQNLDPLQIALAHRYQSHPQSPRSSNPGSVTFQLCRNRTLQLCGYTRADADHRLWIALLQLQHPRPRHGP